MKRQRRSRSRKSPATSPRSGEPTYPHRPGETASSSARYGESASYASAAPERRMHHRKSEETTVRPKRRQKNERSGDRYVWIPKRLVRKFDGDLQAALKAYADEGGIVPAPFRREDGADYRILFDHISSSSIRSGDTQEEVPFDGEETSLPLKLDKKPESTCSRDRGKITQDEDGQSDKKPCLAVEDEQHSGRIGVHAIEEHKQEQESARGHVQALLDMDDETILNNTCRYFKHLNYQSPEHADYLPLYEEAEIMELYEQLALYRIRAYELTVDRKLDKLDDVNLKLQYSPSKLHDKDFFRYLEDSLEWYFDLERCKSPRFDNYQRLVLHDYWCGYLDWDFYHSILNTYEEDQEYVQYFEAVAKKTKWVEDYLGVNLIQWEKIRSVVFMQALETAESFPKVSPLLVTHGFNEYICRLQYDYFSFKGLDGLYFEIWKRLAKGKMSFKEALMEIHSKDMFPLRSFEIKRALEIAPNRSPIKDFYDAHVAGIDKMASDDEVRQLIRESIRKKMASKPKHYLGYARKKLNIAKDIELIP